MNMEKFTERSRGFLQAAQTIAMREGHQRVVPEHLLKALMDDDQGLSSNLIQRAGGEPKRVAEAVDQMIAKMPKVSGGDGQVYIDTSLVRVLDEAEKVAKKAGDSFVPVERILMALAMVNTKAKDALSAGAVTAQNLNAAINDIRKGRTADSASAEEGYDALKKYARDLTQAAEEGRI
ncbi:MAG: ATP-dependent chaperone ClpB, partial [Rhodobacteraceae bacterium]|nr:ATP-dependent chaperone ClpB [Paracoccaceae bacterium]